MDGWDIPTKLHREPTPFPLLDGSNYTHWKKNMSILLHRVGLARLIQEDKPDEPPLLSEAWFRADGWAFPEIYFRCTPDLQLSLSDTMTAYDAWQLLQDLYIKDPLLLTFWILIPTIFFAYIRK